MGQARSQTRPGNQGQVAQKPGHLIKSGVSGFQGFIQEFI